MEKKLVGSIVVIDGSKKNTRIELFAGDTVTFGRSLDSDFCIADETVSRKHGDLLVTREALTFQNYGANGTLVNDEKIDNTRLVFLKHGDKLQVGSMQLRVEMPSVEEKKTVIIPATPATPTPPGTEPFPKAGGRFGTMVLPAKKAPKNNTMFFVPKSAKAEKTEKIEKDHLGKRQDSKKNDRARTGTRPGVMAKKGEASFLKTPMQKVIAGLVIFIGFVYVLGTSQEPDDAKPRVEQDDIVAEEVKEKVPASEWDEPVTLKEGEIPASELAQAQALFRSAERLFSERKLRPRNLYDSIRKWQKGLDILAGYTDAERHQAYTTAAINLRSATTKLDTAYAKLKKNVLIYTKQQKFQSAYDLIQDILKTIPDINDPRYAWAKEFEVNELKPQLRTKL